MAFFRHRRAPRHHFDAADAGHRYRYHITAPLLFTYYFNLSIYADIFRDDAASI